MANASFNLSDLNGSNGFVINGIGEFDFLGEVVSDAGDINGDGIADLIIGAPRSDSNASNSGVSYVVFGSTTVGLGGSFNLTDLNGSNGFVISNANSEVFDYLGSSVSSAGDINNDGIDDLIVGASGDDANGNNSGASYVLFGNTNIGLGGSFGLSNLNGSNGFVINGVDASDWSGSSVSSAEDINGDGIDDLIIGAPGVDANGDSGATYVLFGGTNIGLGGSFNLSELDGSNGFVINGIELEGDLGESVSSAGDINGDGIGDLIIGVPGFGLNNSRSGTSYVVFGGTTIGSGGSFDLSNLDSSNGFVINGFEALDRLGETVSSAGDVNGDGIDDVIIAAPGVDENSISYGTSYVVFGDTTIGSSGSFDLSNLDGSNGFVIDGVDAFDNSGFSVRVSGAGDINSDGIADLIIGTPGDLGDGTVSGSSYVVFGGTTLGAGGSFNLSDLNGSNGFRLVGIDVGDSAGYSVSGAGDINSDGITDLIIGAPGVDANGNVNSGASYVVFGSGTQALVPNAVNDFAITTINTPAMINVLTNDTLPNGTLQPINSFEATSTNGGTLTLDDGGTPDDLTDDQLLYTPAEGFIGSDRFSYSISDGSGGLLTATVNVAVFSMIGTFNDDTISGSSNPDWFLGKAGNDTLNGFAGNDGLFGYVGDDTLIGASGNDWLRGGVGNDLIDGGIGNDRLVGGEGNDTLTGGSGSDRFLFQVGQGTDTLTDFEDGIDYFLLANGLTFEQLDISQSNNDTLISITSNGEVLATLNGVSANLLTQTDFISI